MNETAKKQLKETLLAIAKTEIRITYRKSDTPISALRSKIGGKPAVPKNFIWPYYTGVLYGENKSKSRPLSFLAQINLKDIADFESADSLPKSGILSFFYELETMTWGFDPKDKGSAKIFYFPDESELSFADYPKELDEYARLPENVIDFKPHLSLPDYREFADRTDYEWDDYIECCAECGYEADEDGDYTKLFGYPDILQNPMEVECESVTRGYRLGGSEDFSKIPLYEEISIKIASSEWMMLFQMGTIQDDNYELMFGDCGHIYFWITKSDLKNGNFDNIWLILQCG